jgi:hypothetical protein
MAQETLVETQIADGARLAAQLDRDGGEVGLAFWALTTEDDEWHLHLVSGAVDTIGPIDVYRLLQAALKGMSGSSLDRNRIHLLSPSDPMAEDVRIHKEFQRDYHRPDAIYRTPGGQLGNTPVTAYYIYPSLMGSSQSNPPAAV